MPPSKNWEQNFFRVKIAVNIFRISDDEKIERDKLAWLVYLL